MYIISGTHPSTNDIEQYYKLLKVRFLSGQLYSSDKFYRCIKCRMSRSIECPKLSIFTDNNVKSKCLGHHVPTACHEGYSVPRQIKSKVMTVCKGSF